MSASLVGSEMCIRDSLLLLARAGILCEPHILHPRACARLALRRPTTAHEGPRRPTRNSTDVGNRDRA
eukprot:6121659-Alexandrium_andersonii.AAC.1